MNGTVLRDFQPVRSSDGTNAHSDWTNPVRTLFGVLEDMATNLNELGKRAFSDIAAGITPADLEQFKLERLQELRAVIDSLRTESRGGEMLGVMRDRRFRG